MLKYGVVWLLAEKLSRVCLEVLHSLSNLGEMPGKIMITKEDCFLADANCTSLSHREPSGHLGLMCHDVL